jgi:hypothetical protein
MAPKQAYSGHIFAAQSSFALHFNTAPQAGGRDFGEPSLILAPFLSVSLSPKMTLLFHAGGTPTLPSVAALKGARASCPMSLTFHVGNRARATGARATEGQI